MQIATKISIFKSYQNRCHISDKRFRLRSLNQNVVNFILPIITRTLNKDKFTPQNGSTPIIVMD